MKKFLVFSILFVHYLFADISIIVNKENTLVSISKSELKVVFFLKSGKSVLRDSKFVKYNGRFANGLVPLPVDIETDNPIYEKFYIAIATANIEKMNRYWSRRIFSGRGVPPLRLKNEQEIIEFVKKNKNAIGYINQSNLTDDVKEIFTISFP